MATFTITPTPGHNVTYGFKDDMFDFESNPPKPALYDAAPDLAERLARSSDGSAHDVAAVARLWDPSCSVHQRIGRPDLLVVQSCTELPDVAKEHIRLASQAAVNIQYEIADPWVKVGTTTIDGDVCGLWESEDLDEMRGRVRFIGGHHLRLEWWETNRGVDIAFCDIVRRLSECCEYCDREHLTPDQRERASECAACSASIAAKMEQRPDVKAIAEKHGLRYREQACPECGPHGNTGRVLLLESWVDCGTCKPDASAVVFDEEVEVQRARDQGSAVGRADIGLRGAMEVAALRSTLTEATVDNLRRYEALMADFKADIATPTTPLHMHMAFDQAGYRPGEVSFAASELHLPAQRGMGYPTEGEHRAAVLAKLNKYMAGPQVEETSVQYCERIRIEIKAGMRAPDGKSFMDARREELAALWGTLAPNAAPERPVG